MRDSSFCRGGNVTELYTLYTKASQGASSPSELSPSPAWRGGRWVMSSWVRKGAVDLSVLPITVGACGRSCTSQVPSGLFTHSRSSKKGWANLCFGYLQESGLTQAMTASAVARMLLVNTSENYKDPNSFWTNHSDLMQLLHSWIQPCPTRVILC